MATAAAPARLAMARAARARALFRAPYTALSTLQPYTASAMTQSTPAGAAGAHLSQRGAALAPRRMRRGAAAWRPVSVALPRTRTAGTACIHCVAGGAPWDTRRRHFSAPHGTSDGRSGTGIDDHSSTERARPRRAQPSEAHLVDAPYQRLLLAAASAVLALSNPLRDDMVAALGESTGGPALRNMRDKMRADSVGQRLLEEQPRITEASIDMAALRQLPRHKFGRVYADYMDSHAFSPDKRADVRFVSDPELAYVMQRYREVHDFWHALSGLPPTVLGEVALKWLEMVQTELPSCALSAFVGPLRVDSWERKLLWTTYAPWASRVGAEAVFLMNVDYEALLHTDVDEVRELLRFEAAPPMPERTRRRDQQRRR